SDLELDFDKDLAAKKHKELKNKTLRSFAAKNLHPHDLVAGIHVNNLASNRRGAIAGEKRSRRAEFFRQNISFQRRVRFVMLEHFLKTGNAARGERIDGTGADAIDANFFRAQIIGEIAR